MFKNYDLIKKYSKENDLIFDCFMGSGTTPYACEQLAKMTDLWNK